MASSRSATARHVPAAGDETTLDAAKCPRGCGSMLSFRSNPQKFGRTESRCDTCGTPWTPVKPAVEVPAFERPDDDSEDARAAKLRLASPPLRAVGATPVRGPMAVTRGVAVPPKVELPARPKRAPAREQVLSVLPIDGSAAPLTLHEVADACGKNPPTVYAALTALAKEGRVVVTRLPFRQRANGTSGRGNLPCGYSRNPDEVTHGN